MKGPNWKRIEQLRDFLRDMKETPHRKFDMSTFLTITSGPEEERFNRTMNAKISVATLRKNGEECGTMACLAGWAAIRFAPKTERISYDDIVARAEKLLGLNDSEAAHMFYRHWGDSEMYASRADAVKYLTKAIKAKNVMVSL